MRIEDLIILGKIENRKPNSPKENYRKCKKTVMRIGKLIPTLHPQSHQLLTQHHLNCPSVLSFPHSFSAFDWLRRRMHLTHLQESAGKQTNSIENLLPVFLLACLCDKSLKTVKMNDPYLIFIGWTHYIEEEVHITSVHTGQAI